MTRVAPYDFNDWGPQMPPNPDGWDHVAAWVLGVCAVLYIMAKLVGG